jgi:uncharacterized protein (TIRG00374 family)
MEPAAIRRMARFAVQLAVSGGILAFLLFQIDVSRTFDLIGESNAAYLAAALAIFLVTTWFMAWRWQILLASKGLDEPLGWLTRLHFIGYAASQVLPTSIGGDAVRIVEHARRRPHAKGEAAGAVVMERALGATGTLLLLAVGLAIAAGRYEDLDLVLWLELSAVGAMALLAVLVFSRRTARRLEKHVFPRGGRFLERLASSFYGALHTYRAQPAALAAGLVLTLATQVPRVFAIWLCGEAVGLDLSPLVYVVLGPLLFVVMMVPFTINGLGVREAFFVAFLGRFGVEADAAFATGFVFYVVTVATAVPGGVILFWRSVRGARARPRPG